MKEENQNEIADKLIGKYIEWQNGYRLYVVGRDPKWPAEYIVRDPKSGREWTAVCANIAGKKEITEELALQDYALIEVDKPQFAFCCCGSWRIGQPNVSITMDLEQGKIPVNECQRIEEKTRIFFASHGISLRARRSENGVELEFISMKSNSDDTTKGCCGAHTESKEV